jgi:hypothetical protein
MVYQGELPRRNTVARPEVDAGTRQVDLSPSRGNSFRTECKVFLSGDDPWFRPVDACNPGQLVFVADWYDAGVGSHAFNDQTTGHYRVAGPQSQNQRRLATPVGGAALSLKHRHGTRPPALIDLVKSPRIPGNPRSRRP